VIKKGNEKHVDVQLSLMDFIRSYNENMPSGYALASEEQLLQFKSDHVSLFKNGDMWSIDQHRKRIIDWLPQANRVR